MNILRTRNVHRALPLALEILNAAGQKRGSRNSGTLGDVRVVDGPVTTVYDHPTERVLFWPQRDANPFFHFFESLWMLGGKHDVASVTRYAKRFASYSDDGESFHGAYGYRWRVGMPGDPQTQDQLAIIGDRLLADVTDRRCMLQMWDSRSDLGRNGKDVPCNTMATFQVDGEGNLNMVVFCRSNDIVWGCYGANAVQFSMLLEYMAFRTRTKVGTYHQISVNWHGYDATSVPLYNAMVDEKTGNLANLIDADCPYQTGEVKPYPIAQEGTTSQEWDIALLRLLRAGGRAPIEGSWPDPFFTEVAIPILRAHDAYKDSHGEDKYTRSLDCLAACHASDWRKACSEWVMRRWNKYRKDSDDGPVAVG